MSLYTVPEMVESSGGKCRDNEETPPHEGDGGGGDEKAAKQAAAGQTHRAASVMRYKEKRQNRLFSKTIRYQVRKLNAEKRPRVKVIYLSTLYHIIDNSHLILYIKNKCVILLLI